MDIEKLENGNYNILGYKGNKTEIEIHYKIEDGFVESVSLYAGSELSQQRKKNIEKIIIPSGIKKIKDDAFKIFFNLKQFYNTFDK